ncbi:pseudaminic acid synthase [uncultured Aliiroseovarius sp.]|uniref:pseudaminic acid synthase n=1 Tax=uncultured Aliiroseovarius sp. TaxID=1658783 RepID=UPI0025917AE6|nr:pseudaminic acid synthase [uncultured Aliiroseovarius sp.]
MAMLFDTLSIGGNHPCYLIAEVSANHNNDLNRALEIVRSAAEAGANAVKLQTYTADTLTIPSDRKEFRVTGTIWDKETLHSLYRQAELPWEWHRPIFEEAASLGMNALSTPFDFTSVDFLSDLGVSMFKIASSELVDIPLLKYVAQTGKPVILSTGMGTEVEIQEALQTLRENGCPDVCVLKCTAAYPAKVEEAHMRSIAEIPARFGAIPGLSDHTMGTTVPVVAVALGAKLIEKHITLNRSDGGPDSTFSLEPKEFSEMVEAVRDAEAALGQVQFSPTAGEIRPRDFRRSLYVVKDMTIGETFTPENLKSIRPAKGLHTRHYETVLGTAAKRGISAGTPLNPDMLVINVEA